MPEFQLDTGEPAKHFAFDALPDIARGYIEAALFLATGATHDGEPVEVLDAGLDQLPAEMLGGMAADACRFWIEAAETLALAIEESGGGNYDLTQAGRDFWFSRNRTGVGFGDRGLGDLGEALADRARAWGECDLIGEPVDGADPADVEEGRAEAFVFTLDHAPAPLTEAERAELSRLQGAPVPPLPVACAKYGAPMGRRSDRLDGAEAALVAVTLDPDGYDAGGAYWGRGAPLWRAVTADGAQAFVRATTRAEAARIVATENPGVVLS